MPVIGFMSARSPEDTVQELNAFHRGLGEGSFTDRRNATIEYRWARGDYARMPELAAELVQQRVNVLVATGGDASARAAKAATEIRVVFMPITAFGMIIGIPGEWPRTAVELYAPICAFVLRRWSSGDR